MQPGDTITPGEKSPAETPTPSSEHSVEQIIDHSDQENEPSPPATTNSPLPAQAPIETKEPSQVEDSTQVTPTPQTTQSLPTDLEPAGWNYTEDAGTVSPVAEPVTWSASEFIDHEKPASWFAGVAGITVLLVGVVYLVTRDVVNAVAILIVAGLFAVFGARRPRTLQYGLDMNGIRIGVKAYAYSELKSFAIMKDDAINSIQIIQLKRFSTPITLYFPPDQENTIVSFLGNYLPNEILAHDPIDRLMRKVRF